MLKQKFKYKENQLKDYIKWIRNKIGHDTIILNFSGAIIRDEKNRILLQKRSDNGQWGFPGGAVELGESIDEAMFREVKEETGLSVAIESFQGTYSKYFNQYPNGDKAQTITSFFSCKVIDGTITVDKNESLELRFFEVNQIPVLFTQQHVDALDDYINNKSGVFR